MTVEGGIVLSIKRQRPSTTQDHLERKKRQLKKVTKGQNIN